MKRLEMGPRTSATLGLSTGPIMVLLFYAAAFLLLGKPPNLSEELFVIVFQIAWTSLPFLFLWLTDRRALSAWLGSATAILAFFAALLWFAIEAKRDETGANIGMGLLFLVLPFIVIGVAALVSTPHGENSPSGELG